MISIIVPVYNTEEYLPRCLDSILQHNIQDIEIVVVNDASPGNCNEIVNEYICKHENIKLVENKNNLGLYNTRIVGIKNASKKYIMHVDSDDYLLNNSLNNLINILKVNDYDILVFNHIIKYDNGNTEKPHRFNYINKNLVLNAEQAYYELFFGCLPESMHSKVFKRSLYQDFEIVDRNITFQEDFLAIPRLLYNSKQIKLITDEYYVYYHRDDSSTKFHNMSFQSKKKTLEDLVYVNSFVNQFFKDKGLDKQYESGFRFRNNMYFTWIYNDMVFNLNANEYTEITNLIRDAFTYTYQFQDILNKIEYRRNNYTDDKYFISVVIPVHNTEKYLKRCLDSILNQDFKDIELVIVNDCSPGNCDEVLKEYLDKYENIVYVKNPSNLGSAWSRINGVSNAHGKYIHFVDSDDWLYHDAYEKIHRYLNDEYEVLHFDGIYASDTDTWEIYFQIPENKTLIGPMKAFDDMFENDLRRRPLWSRVFDKKCLFKSVKFMPKLHLSIADDWILNLFTLFFVEKYRSVSDVMYYYYQNNPNAMTAHIESKTVDLHTVKMNNTIMQTMISYTAVVDFLKSNGVWWDNYRKYWIFYITRDLRYQFINIYANYENYFLQLFENNKEQYLKETYDFFALYHVKTSNLLNFIEYNMYESTCGYIDAYLFTFQQQNIKSPKEEVINIPEPYQEEVPNPHEIPQEASISNEPKLSILDYIFSIRRNEDKTIIYMLGIKITLKHK